MNPMRRHWKKWTIAAACLATFLLIASHLDATAFVDAPVYRALSGLYSPFATGFFKACTGLVSPLVLLVIALVVVARIPRRELRVPVLLNLCVAVLLNLGLKHVFSRPRPVDVIHIITETGSSFPSGHTMAAACFYGFLIWIVWDICRSRAVRAALTAFLCALIALVAASRVYLGVHYFTDVLGGLLISAVYLTVFTTMVRRFFEHAEAPHPWGLQPNDRNRLLFSFIYAFEGVLGGFRSERNMVIHFAAMATVVVFGALLGLSAMEWVACVSLFGLVMMAELMNTAVETVVDILCPQYDPRAKLAKDTAAGAVLLAAMASAIAGLIIFVPKILDLLMNEL